MIDFSKLEKFVTLHKAQKTINLTMEAIEGLIEDGTLRAAVMPDGSIGVSWTSIEAILPREELPDYKRFSHLQGTPISISEGSRKYGIATPTITRWMQRGFIARLGKDGRRTLLDEADVAYCASVYKQSSGQGKRAFDDQGRPNRTQSD